MRISEQKDTHLLKAKLLIPLTHDLKNGFLVKKDEIPLNTFHKQLCKFSNFHQKKHLVLTNDQHFFYFPFKINRKKVDIFEVWV